MKTEQTEDEFSFHYIPPRQNILDGFNHKIFTFSVQFDGEEIEIDTRKIASLRTYSEEGEALKDYLDWMHLLSSLITNHEALFNEARTELERAKDKKLTGTRGTLWKEFYRDFEGTEKNKLIPESLVKAHISGLKDIQEKQDFLRYLENCLSKLRAAFDIAKMAWETARTLSANNRKLH